MKPGDVPDELMDAALRDRIAEALNMDRWGGDHDRDTHARHNYLHCCGICRGDVHAIADVAMAEIGPEIDRLRQRAEQAEERLRQVEGAVDRSLARADDAAAARDRWRNRAEVAEAAVERVRALAVGWVAQMPEQVTESVVRVVLAEAGQQILAALDQPKET